MTHDKYFNYLLRRSQIGSMYRRYYLYPRLDRRLQGQALDVGCGIGDMLAFRPKTVGVDINPRTVEHCRSLGLQATMMQGDRLPFDATSFDSVLLDNVLEHIAEPVPLLAEIQRVLRPGGRLLVGVPGACGWDSDPDHKVYYGERELIKCVSAAGFVAREIFHTPLGQSLWLNSHMRQYCIYGAFERL